MKTIFMGTPSFSASVLDTLIKNHIEVMAVVTKEDKKRSRGKGLDFSEVKKRALKDNIMVLQPSKLKETEFIDSIKALSPDIIITAAYGKIIPKEILEIPTFGCINIHASLLPKYRGASPIQQAIMNGDEKTGITVIQMDEGMDTGDILLMEELSISDDETSDELFERLAVLGSKLCLSALNKIENRTITAVRQNHKVATYTSLIPKEAGHINWNHRAVDIVNRIRAIECYSFYNEVKIKILKGKVFELDKEESQMKVGSIVKADKNGFVVKCADSGLHIEKLQLPGKKPFDYKAYINGYRPEIGSFLN